jgi:hypothetical protein
MKCSVSGEINVSEGEYVEVDLSEVLQERFSTGQGVIQLQPGMTDEMMLFTIKRAISLSNGKAFTVIPPLTKPSIS